MQYVDTLNILRETALAHLVKTEEILVANAHGRIAASDVASELTLPPFTNSAVDGFAIPYEVSLNATPAVPVRLKIAGTLFPGEIPQEKTPAGCAWEIMTGAPVPKDCTACAKVEDTIVETEDGLVENARAVPRKSKSVSFKSPLAKNENLRFAGTDFDHGTRVISTGETIRPSHLMALSSVGVTKIKVFKKPKVLLLSTGKELVEPGQPLKTGEIYNSTRIFLKTALEELGCEVEIGPTIADEAQDFIEFMKPVLKSPPDILVTTGAVSMGSADFIRPAIEELDGKVLFHRVDIRPGKPILFAAFKDFVAFGLPGNPISGVVGARFFIAPYLKMLTRQKPERAFTAKLANGFKKPSDLRCFFKAQLVVENGDARVHLMKGQPSYMVRPLLQSSVWAVLKEGVSDIAKDDLVEVYTEDSMPYDFSTAEGDFA